MAYFVIERNGNWIEHVNIVRSDGDLTFQTITSMSYDQMKEYNELEDFVVCAMEATNRYFNESDAQTIVTLIGEDDVFIWSIIIGPGDEDGDLNYVLVDWNKDEKKYKYFS